MTNNQNQGASIKAEREEYSAFRAWWQDHLHEEGSLHPEIFGFEIWKAARRTPAAAAGAGELPPLPEPTCENDNGYIVVSYTNEQMQDYARAAIAVDRAQRQAAHTAEMAQWALDNGLNVPPQWNGTVTDYGTPTAAPASAQPADPWHDAVLAECMRVESCYNAADPAKTIKELIDWHAQEAAGVAETIKVQADNYMRLTCGAQPDQRESAAEGEPERDPLYEKAVQVVRAHNRASLSLVQRTLVLGYNRTARLFEAMEKEGVVSACDANGHRTVLAAAPSLAID